MTRRFLPLVVLAFGLTPVPALRAQADPPEARVRIESADQLPRHMYPVPESATALVEDDAQFAALVENDYETALAYADSVRAIEDKPALKALTGTFERALAAAARAPEAAQATVARSSSMFVPAQCRKVRRPVAI